MQRNLQESFCAPLKGLVDNAQALDLYSDYLLIEDLWSKFYLSLEVINLIIIAEAPLNSDQYILNDSARDTIFLPRSVLVECAVAIGLSDNTTIHN